MDSAEFKDIVISVLAISIAFTLALSDGIFGLRRLLLDAVAMRFIVALVTVGFGFVLHELAHRFMARKYGHYAAYQAWPMGLQLALITSLFGFVFAAPGATVIYAHYLSRREHGVISVIGPLTNVALAFLFVAALPIYLLLLPIELATLIFAYGYQINLWLAFFNLLPFGPLDGKKVMAWNSTLWLTLIVSIFLLLFVFPLPLLFL
ncbi:site-2 protease family protein [Candidatus Micrarchaeota archaeon]|nr:MAG: site-2 protease family protein [Candidatus Micrarchaeota archaeon]